MCKYLSSLRSGDGQCHLLIQKGNAHSSVAHSMQSYVTIFNFGLTFTAAALYAF